MEFLDSARFAFALRFGWTPDQVGKLKMDKFWMYLAELEDMSKREDKPNDMTDKRTQDVMFDPRYKEG